MELWLVRHGTTKANLEGRLQGTLPFPLGSQGKREVASLARRLREQSFSAFFCSNVLRTRQTASILHKNAQTPPYLLTPLLREYHWGIIQGMTRPEIGKKYPWLLEQLEQDFYRAKIPGAEGIKKLFRRATRFFNFLKTMEQAKKHKQPVLIVSHGRFLQAFIQHFLAYDRRRGWPFSASPASLTILEGDFRGLRRLKLFNDTCHLRGNGGR